MGRGKTRSVLLTELGTKVYCVLLASKQELTGYQIAKEVYRGRTLLSSQKIYETLKRMKKEGLINSAEKKLGEKRSLVHSANFGGLAKAFSSIYISKEMKLNEKELKQLGFLLSKTRYSWTEGEPKMFRFSNTGVMRHGTSFLEMLALFLYNIAVISKNPMSSFAVGLEEELAIFKKFPLPLQNKLTYMELPGIQRAIVEWFLIKGTY